MNLLERKHKFVYEAMNEIDCFEFHICGDDAKEIAKMHNVDFVETDIVEIKIHLDYKFEDRNDGVNIRVNYQPHYFDKASEEMIDLAFQHFAVQLPLHFIEKEIEHEASRRAHDFSNKILKSLDDFRKFC